MIDGCSRILGELFRIFDRRNFASGFGFTQTDLRDRR